MNLYTTDPIKIALVDDHLLFRAGLKALFQEEDDIEVVMEADNGADFLQALRLESPIPDIVLLDIRMPQMDGYNTAGTLLRLFPQLKIIILSVHQEERHIVRMIEIGINGYLMKSASPAEVISCIRFVMEYKYYFNKKIVVLMQRIIMFNQQGMELSRAMLKNVSERELEILKLICREYTNKEIADALSVSIRTVEGHRKRLLSKFGVKNTAGLVVAALKNNLIDINLV